MATEPTISTWLRCSHCVGVNCKEYLMKCDVLKAMPDGRVKIKVYGDRYWKPVEGGEVKTSIRYVDSYRIYKKTE